MPSIPRPFVEAYWLGYVSSQQDRGPGLDLTEVPSTTPVSVAKIAFYNLYPADLVSVCFGMSQNHGWDYTHDGIKELQAHGTRVLASIIGTPHPPVGWNDIPDPKAFAVNVKALLIDHLGCDGIDIDNEDPATPDKHFEAVVTALRSELGPKGSDNALLTYVSYLPDRDLPWLRNVGDAFDWVSTMAYGEDTSGQIALWRQYAEVLGPENVLIGVASGTPGDPNVTDLATVGQVAQWVNNRGPGKTGGMMLWNLSTGNPTLQYYGTIRRYLRIWTPPGQPG
jgi:chitinase